MKGKTCFSNDFLRLTFANEKSQVEPCYVPASGYSSRIPQYRYTERNSIRRTFRKKWVKEPTGDFGGPAIFIARFVGRQVLAARPNRPSRRRPSPQTTICTRNALADLEPGRSAAVTVSERSSRQTVGGLPPSGTCVESAASRRALLLVVSPPRHN